MRLVKIVDSKILVVMTKIFIVGSLECLEGLKVKKVCLMVCRLSS